MSDFDLNRAIRKIRQLHRLKEKFSTMYLAPKNTWISQYTIRRYYPESETTHYYTYAKWESVEPIFICRPKHNLAVVDLNIEDSSVKKLKYTRHQHIGRVSSTSGLTMDRSVEIAYRELRNRRWLDRVESALNKIESAIREFQ
jgi:hypothetical protein